MVTLKQIGDMGMALYYQNYKADDQYFDLAHFKFLITSRFAEIINEEAKQNKLQNRGMTGFSFIEISSDWLMSEEKKLQFDDRKKHHFVELDKTPFPFDYDAMGSAVQYVTQIGEGCGEFQRISINDKWMVCSMPASETPMYYVDKNKIIFLNLKCKLKEVEVQYVPLIDCNDDTSSVGLHEDKVFEIIGSVLNLMFGAKNGNIVDMSNNSNPNTVPQGEVDPNVVKK